MITIEHARKTLGKRAETMTDEQIQKLINQLVILCDITIDAVINRKKKGQKE